MEMDLPFRIQSGGTSTKFVQLWRKREKERTWTQNSNNKNNYENGIKGKLCVGNRNKIRSFTRSSYVNDQQRKRRDDSINCPMLIGPEMKTVIILNRTACWNPEQDSKFSDNKKQNNEELKNIYWFHFAILFVWLIHLWGSD